LPELDLEPGDYRERKPKGWRWKLPWSHPEDTKLPMVGFFVAGLFLAFFLINLPPGTDSGVVAGVATFAAVAGAMLVLWLRD
jgi:hypothetical protein